MFQVYIKIQRYVAVIQWPVNNWSPVLACCLVSISVLCQQTYVFVLVKLRKNVL